MIWGPFLLALALGLVVSAGLYFAYLWPSVEPAEPIDAAADDAPAAAPPEPAAAPPEPAADAPAPSAEDRPS